jgi:hypothetical protein
MSCQHGLVLQEGEYKPSLALEKKFKNVTVEILKCEVCGEVSIGWYRQDNTEEVE